MGFWYKRCCLHALHVLLSLFTLARLQAANVLSSFGLLSEPDRVRLEMLAQRAVAAGSAAEEADEEAGGDVPEEFLCEIMATVMKVGG